MVDLLLVGWRGGLRKALRKVAARRVAVLVPEGDALPEADEIDRAASVDLHGPPSSIAETAAALLDGGRPSAVVAAAERTVLAAARLRADHGLPGNDPEVALRCADKVVMKRAMDAAGVPVARWREVGATTEATELIDALGLPLMLKPRRDSGGRGQVRCDDPETLARALRDLNSDDGTSHGWLAEGWVQGVEMSVETFVRDGAPCFGNPTAYHVPRHASILPAGLASEDWEAVQAFVARALAAAGVERGITHLELFRGEAGYVFGELAIRPPGGRLMPLLQRAWSFDPWEAVLRLELGQPFAFPTRARRAAGAWVLHPGSGTLRAVEGVEAASAVEGVRRVKLKLPAGPPPWSIPPRLGSGQDLGAIFAEGPDAGAVARTLDAAHERLVFRFDRDGRPAT